MLSIGKASLGQENYYLGLAKEDYYTGGGEPQGIWAGSGAHELGLTGVVDGKDFSDLFKGKLRGETLVQELPKKYERVPAWDLTFSAPKSVSVIFSQADEREQKIVRNIQQAAVEKALAYMEENCGFTRRGHKGRIVERAKCLFATFEHGTSRAEQPHLHTHAVMINACVRESGGTGALKTEKFYQHRHTAGAIYRAEMAHQLEQQLGVSIQRDKSSFKVAGVSEELCDHFSKRRKEIEAKLEELGLSGGKVSATITLTTRTTKKKVSRLDLMEEWRKIGREYGWSTKELADILGKSESQPEILRKNQALLAATEAIEEVMKGNAYFKERDLLKLTCWHAQGRGVSADDAQEAVKEVIQSEKLVYLNEIDGESYYSTREQIALESQMMADVEALKEAPSLKISEKVKTRFFDESEKAGIKLSIEQLDAANHILNGDGRISTIIGDAGTGKTTLLKPIAKILEESGYEVRGLALAGIAAEGLQQGAGIESGTIASFLWNHHKTSEGWNEQEAKESFETWVKEKRKTLNPDERKRFNPKWNDKQKEKSKENFEKYRAKHQPLTEKSVVVLDEAGMIDTQQLAEVVKIVKETGAKLVAIGDPKQLQAILQGGGFAGITKAVKGARLTEIFRQKDEKEKEAVSQMGTGSVKEALKHYADENRLSVLSTREEAKSSLISDWKTKGLTNPEENIIVAGTNADVADLNKQAQEIRKNAGLLSGSALAKGDEDFFLGDRVIFKTKDKKLGIENGSRGALRGYNKLLGTVSIELDGEGSKRTRTRSFSLKEYSDFHLGYAMTTHAAQGQTVKNAYLLTDEMMTDRNLSYVQTSRVTEEGRIYTTEEEAGEHLSDLIKRMERDRTKEMALDMLRRKSQQQFAPQI